MIFAPRLGRNCSSAGLILEGEGAVGGGGCYREPSVYVSVNVTSSQDQGSRRAATMAGRGELVHR